MKYKIKDIIKEAEAGNMVHQSMLGGIYFSGYNEPIDRSKALEWFVKAGEQGDRYAQLQVIKMKLGNCSNADALFSIIDISELFNRLK